MDVDAAELVPLLREQLRVLEEILAAVEPSAAVPSQRASAGAWLSVADVVREAGMSPSTVRRAINDGQLRASKPRGVLRVHRDDLEAWLRSSAA